MTANQLHGIVGKCGYQIVVGDNGPSVKPIRPGADLPYRILCLLKTNRHLFLPGAERQEGEEFQTCTVCRALVNLEFAPCFNPDISHEMFGCMLGPTRQTLHGGCPFRGEDRQYPAFEEKVPKKRVKAIPEASARPPKANLFTGSES